MDERERSCFVISVVEFLSLPLTSFLKMADGMQTNGKSLCFVPRLTRGTLRMPGIRYMSGIHWYFYCTRNFARNSLRRISSSLGEKG